MYRSRYSAVWSLRCASFNQSLERNRRAGLPLSVMAFSNQRHTVPFLPNERRSAYGLPLGSRSVLWPTVGLTPAARSPLLLSYLLIRSILTMICLPFMGSCRLYKHRVVRKEGVAQYGRRIFQQPGARRSFARTPRLTQAFQVAHQGRPPSCASRGASGKRLPRLATTSCRDSPFALSAAWRAGPLRSAPCPIRELAARRCGHLRSLARA